MIDWRTYRWQYKIIGGQHCIGMEGNLDTSYDALINVGQLTPDGQEAEEIAKWIVQEHNKMVKQ